MNEPIPDDIKAKTLAVLEQLGKATWMLAVISGVLFYLGYETLNSYYQEFNIPVWILDVPAYTYPINAQGLILWLLLIVLFLAPFTSLLDWWFDRRSVRKGSPRPRPKPPTTSTLLAFVAFVSLCIAFFPYQSGTSKAQAYIQNNSVVATLVFKTPTPPVSRDERLLRANQAGALRMLTQTKDLVIVYEKTADGKLTTYVIARSELSSVRASGIQWHP